MGEVVTRNKKGMGENKGCCSGPNKRIPHGNRLEIGGSRAPDARSLRRAIPDEVADDEGDR